MKSKKGLIDESIFYLAGILIVILFFITLMFAVFFMSVSNSKKNLEASKETATLGTLTNFSFTITLLVIFVVLVLALINYLLKFKKSNDKTKKIKINKSRRIKISK